MRISYWGNFKKILESSYVENIRYFVFEKNKISKEIKNYAIENDVNYYIVSSKSDMNRIIKNEVKPDLTLVGSFGLIFSEDMIEKLNRKIVNIHPGLLPDYRGRHPLPQAILNEEKYMGLTAHVLTKEIDKGFIIKKEKEKINYEESYKENEKKLLNLFPKVIDYVIKKYKKNKINFNYEYSRKGTYYKPLNSKELKRVIESKKLEEL